MTDFSENIAPLWMESGARTAGIHNAIMSIPMGYEMIIGASSKGISESQWQRIFIAGALYRRPAILVIDDAKSHLNQDNQMRIADQCR